jgi:hypothetical protein
MYASERGAHSGALLDPRDAVIQIIAAENKMIEQSRDLIGSACQEWGKGCSCG